MPVVKRINFICCVQFFALRVAKMKIFLLVALVATSGAQSCGPGGSYSIDGSTDVIPIAEAWKNLVESKCPDHNITIISSDSDEAASRVCDAAGGEGPVEIGAMVRDFKVSEATVESNGWLYSCQSSARKIVQVAVAYDSISFAVLKDSAADKCIHSLNAKGDQGLTIDQLRWIFSSLSEEDLVATGWQSNAIDTASKGSRRTWKRLGGSTNENCPDEDILIAGSVLVRSRMKFNLLLEVYSY
jgi:ABC-type phosphate transport system substrate-binding protein